MVGTFEFNWAQVVNNEVELVGTTPEEFSRNVISLAHLAVDLAEAKEALDVVKDQTDLLARWVRNHIALPEGVRTFRYRDDEYTVTVTIAFIKKTEADLSPETRKALEEAKTRELQSPEYLAYMEAKAAWEASQAHREVTDILAGEGAKERVTAKVE